MQKRPLPEISPEIMNSLAADGDGERSVNRAYAGGTRSGRPAANIFVEHRRKRGEHLPHAPDLEWRRDLLKMKHGNWRRMFRGKLASTTLPDAGRAEQALHFEYAQLLMRRKYPQKENRVKAALSEEMSSFGAFLRLSFGANYASKPGRAPDAEKIFRTALCAVVARSLLVPEGGNWRLIPTSRHISQVWYVIFGEEESHKAIEKRLPRLVEWLRNYCESRQSWHKTISYLDRLGRALNEEYPVPARKPKRARELRAEKRPQRLAAEDQSVGDGDDACLDAFFAQFTSLTGTT